jgi:hypothetical protein
MTFPDKVGGSLLDVDDFQMYVVDLSLRCATYDQGAGGTVVGGTQTERD